MIRVSIIVLVILFSCTQKTKVPKNILPPGKMEKLLLDIMKADELVNQKKADSSRNDSFNRGNLYKTIFALHKTNNQEFRKSFLYYETHPEMLKAILDSMHSEVNRKPELKSAPPSKIKRAKLK